MVELSYTTRFKKDVKLCQRQGRDMAKLKEVFAVMLGGGSLPAKYKDHALGGKWKGFRDLHIEPDWLLVYHAGEDVITLAATGSHSYILKM